MAKCICRGYPGSLAQMVNPSLYKHVGSASAYQILPVVSLRSLSTGAFLLESEKNCLKAMQIRDSERLMPYPSKHGSSKNVQKRVYELRQLKTVLCETFGVTEYASFFESLRHALHSKELSKPEKRKLASI